MNPQKRDVIPFADKNAPRIGLGTMSLGGDLCGPMEEKVAHSILEQSLEMGIRIWDTAAFYGMGKAEVLCGEVLSSSGLRNEVTIITKGGLRRDRHTNRPIRNASRTALLQDIEGSLRRLKTDTIDIYQLHWPDAATPVEETATTLRGLQEEGVLRHIGICNSSPSILREFSQWIRIHSHELPFSLLDTSLRTTIMTTSRNMNIPIIAYGTLAQGLLAYDPTQKISTTPLFRSWQPWFRDQLLPTYRKACRDLADWAEQRDKTLPQLAVRYVLDEPGVAIALWGIHRPKQLSALQGALEWSLSGEERKALESIIQKWVSPSSPNTEVKGPPQRTPH